jgi:manganese/zinc/iron transport system permease protein
VSPYWQKEFFPFCLLFFRRLYLLIKGELAFHELAPDEIQVFVLILLSVASALVGTFLVLKKMTMLANSFSHTILVGIALVYLIVGSVSNLKALLVASLICGLFTSLLTHWLTHVIRLQEDASIGLVFTSLFALGVLLITLFTRSVHIGTEAIMGNIDALSLNDLKLAFVIFAFNFLIVLLFYKQFTVSAFDPALASLLGLLPGLSTLLLLFLASCTAVGAFRAVGVLLFLALLVGPVLTARLLTHRLYLLIPLSAFFGSIASFFGVAFARHLLSVKGVALSTAGLVVLFIALLFLLCLFIRAWRLRGSKAIMVPKVDPPPLFIRGVEANGQNAK